MLALDISCREANCYSVAADVSSVAAAFFSAIALKGFELILLSDPYYLPYYEQLYLITFIIDIVVTREFEIWSNVLLVKATLAFCFSLVSKTLLITSIAILELVWSASTTLPISWAELLDSSASFLISSATTANPLPDSPVLATSIAAMLVD